MTAVERSLFAKLLHICYRKKVPFKSAYANEASIVNIDLYLTNRFHVAVHLSFNRSQMMSKCGKNKKVAQEAIAECVTDVLTTF